MPFTERARTLLTGIPGGARSFYSRAVPRRVGDSAGSSAALGRFLDPNNRALTSLIYPGQAVWPHGTRHDKTYIDDVEAAKHALALRNTHVC